MLIRVAAPQARPIDAISREERVGGRKTNIVLRQLTHDSEQKTTKAMSEGKAKTVESQLTVSNWSGLEYNSFVHRLYSLYFSLQSVELNGNTSVLKIH